MKNEKQRTAGSAVWMLAAFLLWTVAVRFVDVQGIGPLGSAVGFAAMNRFVHNLTGVHMPLYVITDWLSIVPLVLAAGFALLGMVQWIRRKNFRKVDFSILVLGGFYLAVLTVYVLFEVVAVNYGPVLIDGILEVSYPSSTTMLVICVMQTAVIQLRVRIKKEAHKKCILAAMHVFTVLMVMGRILSGVHWFSDIIGGVLLSTGLVQLYRAIVSMEVT